MKANLPVDEDLIDRTEGMCLKAICNCSMTPPFKNTVTPPLALCFNWIEHIVVTLKLTAFGYKDWHYVRGEKKKVYFEALKVLFMLVMFVDTEEKIYLYFWVVMGYESCKSVFSM